VNSFSVCGACWPIGPLVAAYRGDLRDVQAGPAALADRPPPRKEPELQMQLHLPAPKDCNLIAFYLRDIYAPRLADAGYLRPMSCG
jgi:hypothetical protein